MNRVKEVERINSKDLKLQLASDAAGNAGRWNVESSWHGQYKDSAYVYVGGLDVGLTEGDVAVVFSQLGEGVDVHLPRDKKTGKPRGFAFVGYEDQRSTVLAVDNFNGAKVLGRTLRCDHCADFKEEQKKDPDAIPDHVARKLSEQQLQEKREQIERCALAAPRVPRDVASIRPRELPRCEIARAAEGFPKRAPSATPIRSAPRVAQSQRRARSRQRREGRAVRRRARHGGDRGTARRARDQAGDGRR